MATCALGFNRWALPPGELRYPLGAGCSRLQQPASYPCNQPALSGVALLRLPLPFLLPQGTLEMLQVGGANQITGPLPACLGAAFPAVLPDSSSPASRLHPQAVLFGSHRCGPGRPHSRCLPTRQQPSDSGPHRGGWAGAQGVEGARHAVGGGAVAGVGRLARHALGSGPTGRQRQQLGAQQGCCWAQQQAPEASKLPARRAAAQRHPHHWHCISPHPCRRLQNDLTGSIPASLASLPNLMRFTASNNSLTSATAAVALVCRAPRPDALLASLFARPWPPPPTCSPCALPLPTPCRLPPPVCIALAQSSCCSTTTFQVGTGLQLRAYISSPRLQQRACSCWRGAAGARLG